MVEQAVSNGYPGVEFSILGMLETLAGESDRAADGILCLGNTLPHLASYQDLDRYFRESSRILKPGGFLLIQILNYSRIMAAGHLSMPDLESGRLLFRRKQEYHDGENRVIFHTEVHDGSRVEARSHAMLPLRLDELEDRAAAAGLKPGAAGSSWDGAPVSEDSIWFHAQYIKE